MLRLGCRRISAVQNEMIMKKLSGSGKVLPLFGLIVESFAYHAEEFNSLSLPALLPFSLLCCPLSFLPS